MSVLEKKVLSRRDFFKAAGSTLAALTLSGCASFAMGGPKKQPNVVFILADDLGYTDLSCMARAYVLCRHIHRIRLVRRAESAF